MNYHQTEPETPKLDEHDQKKLWKSFSEALGAEPRERSVIRGASGLDHPVQAIAVDDKNKRVIIISAEQNARIAAMMHGDVQATMPDVKVLIARPVIVDLGVIARKVFRSVEGARVNLNDFKGRMDRFNKLDKARTQKYMERQLGKTFQPLALAFKHVTLPALTQIVDVVEQAAYLDWSAIFETFKETPDNPSISFANLMTIDNMEVDRKFGVCPIPLYEFTESDWNLFFDSNRTEELRVRLREMNIYQYFFPSPDQLALGLADNGINDCKDIIQVVENAGELGHPMGQTEIVPSLTNLPEILEALSELGYLAEGENGIEVTPAGQTHRMSIKYRPRESLISKLINRFTLNANVSISPKDLFPPV